MFLDLWLKLFRLQEGTHPVTNRPMSTEKCLDGFPTTAGGSWESPSGTLGYFVSEEEEVRQVDTSHVSQSLASRIECLDLDLRLPLGYLVNSQQVTLIDVPCYSEPLAERIRSLVSKELLIIFTHYDFLAVAEPQKWRKAFEDVRIVAHSADVKALEDLGCAADVERLEGPGPWDIGDFKIYMAAGHTEGSLIVSSESLSTSFGGDTAGCWEGKITGFPSMARFSCMAQAESLRTFADQAPFYRHWLPGHGRPMQFEDLEDRSKKLQQIADELEEASKSGEVAAP